MTKSKMVKRKRAKRRKWAKASLGSKNKILIALSRNIRLLKGTTRLEMPSLITNMKGWHVPLQEWGALISRKLRGESTGVSLEMETHKTKWIRISLDMFSSSVGHPSSLWRAKLTSPSHPFLTNSWGVVTNLLRSQRQRKSPLKQSTVRLLCVVLIRTTSK